MREQSLFVCLYYYLCASLFVRLLIGVAHDDDNVVDETALLFPLLLLLVVVAMAEGQATEVSRPSRLLRVPPLMFCVGSNGMNLRRSARLRQVASGGFSTAL